jgi:hypothetical protein
MTVDLLTISLSTSLLLTDSLAIFLSPRPFICTASSRSNLASLGTMTKASTQGLNEAQIESVTRAVISPDRLFWLAPFLVGFWLNALLFGVLVVLFVKWQTGVAKTDKAWVKVIVVRLGPVYDLCSCRLVGMV